MQYRPKTLTPAQQRRRQERLARRAAARGEAPTSLAPARPAKTRWTFAALRARRVEAKSSLTKFLAQYWANLQAVAMRGRYTVRCPYRHIYKVQYRTVVADPCGGKLKRTTNPDIFECRTCGRPWSRLELAKKVA